MTPRHARWAAIPVIAAAALLTAASPTEAAQPAPPLPIGGGSGLPVGGAGWGGWGSLLPIGGSGGLLPPILGGGGLLPPILGGGGGGAHH